MVPATSSRHAPISSDWANAVDSSETATPTACQPTIRWLSRRATTRTKPLFDSRLMARPLAANGNCATMQSRPCWLACSGVLPTTTSSGSVKHTAAIAAGSKRRALPAMISATISPWAMARCASIGSPATSPMAQTLCMLV
ncbi:hypothetical protein D9M71_723550 [compost metagenome]